MKKFLLVCLFALLPAFVFAQEPKEKFNVIPGFTITPSKPEEKEKPKEEVKKDRGPLWFTCRIAVDHGNNAHAYGSGTLVADEGGKTLVLTNAHVVRRSDADKPITVTVQGKTYKARYVTGSEVTNITKTTININGPDLCLLELPVSLGAVNIAETVPTLGEEVWMWGYAGGAQAPVMRTGKIIKSQTTEIDTAFVSQPGDSGSGIFNSKGQLVGVVHGRSTSDERSYALPLPIVCKVFECPLVQTVFPRISSWVTDRCADKQAARNMRELQRVPQFEQIPKPLTSPAKEQPKVEQIPTLPKPLTAPTPVPEKPKTASPTIPVVPYGTGKPPSPAGDGWMYDEQRKVYWRWSNTMPYSGNQGGVTGSVPYTGSGVCPNGNCAPPETGFRPFGGIFRVR